MSDLVPPDQIESIVGANRHTVQHLARAVSAEQTAYVLHSQRCLNSGVDLRECPYSIALDRGIDLADWDGFLDRPVVVTIMHDRLFPLVPKWLSQR